MFVSNFSRAVTLSALFTAAAGAGVVIPVDYTVSNGGTNNSPLNGLAARGEFAISGNTLTITLRNTATGLPAGFDGAASLLVSIGFNLPAGVNIASGVSALISPGSAGFNGWAGRGAGASVGDDWLWTNDFGGDLMDQGQINSSRQVISTSSGQGSGTETRFDGLAGSINGPSGGIGAPGFIPNSLHGVNNAITFTLTLNQSITQQQLQTVANGAVVEFGSDVRYLHFPAPGTASLVVLAGLIASRRKR